MLYGQKGRFLRSDPPLAASWPYTLSKEAGKNISPMRGRFSEVGLIPPPHLVLWWGSPHFHTEAPSTGVAECRADLVRWAPQLGEWPVPPLGLGGKFTPFFQPGGQPPPPPTPPSRRFLVVLLTSCHFPVILFTRTRRSCRSESFHTTPTCREAETPPITRL